MLQKLRALSLPRRRSLVVTVVVMLLGASYCFYLATQLPNSLLPGYPGDGFFPRITLAVTLVCGVVILIREFFRSDPGAATVAGARDGKDDDEAEDDTSGPIQFDLLEAVTIIVLSIGYMALMPLYGMEIMTTIFMFLLFFPRILMPWPKAAVVAALSAAATTGFVYFAFVIGLNVPLPLAFLPRYLGQY